MTDVMTNQTGNFLTLKMTYLCNFSYDFGIHTPCSRKCHGQQNLKFSKYTLSIQSNLSKKYSYTVAELSIH